MNDRVILFHVDMDSPQTLLQFWGVPDVQPDMEKFYAAAMARALEFFSGLQVPVTFFCIGGEIENSAVGRRYLREAFDRGYEIANHTYTHPTDLTQFPDGQIHRELEDCSRVIREITGQSPVGFRAPSYAMNARVLKILDGMGFLYDSSAFWTSLNPLIRIYHRLFSKNSRPVSSFGKAGPSIPRDPYYPSETDWMKRSSPRGILEFPLPRTALLQLPYLQQLSSFLECLGEKTNGSGDEPAFGCLSVSLN